MLTEVESVEIGPHPALKSPLQEILKAGGKSVAYASTLKRKEDGRRSMLQLAGSLFSVNATVDLAAVNAVDEMDGTGLKHGCTSIDLPPYQYTYGGLNYHEIRASKEYRFRSVLRHDLLGSKGPGNAKLRPLWRNILRVKDVPWLSDHRLLPGEWTLLLKLISNPGELTYNFVDMVLPGAGYIAMAVEATTRIHNEFPEPSQIKGFSLRDVMISKSLTIPEDDYGVEVLTSMELVEAATAKSPAWATFSISSVGRENNEWSEHSKGLVKVEVIDTDDIVVSGHSVVAPTSPLVSTRAWYKRFSDVGLGYGPTFRPLSDIRQLERSGGDDGPSHNNLRVRGRRQRRRVQIPFAPIFARRRHPVGLDRLSWRPPQGGQYGIRTSPALEHVSRQPYCRRHLHCHCPWRKARHARCLPRLANAGPQ